MSKKLSVTFLGTGTSSGVPMIGCHCAVCTSDNAKDNRLRSSVLLSTDTTKVVIDTTPDFRQQMLRIKNEQLDAVIYTHAHKDHIAGLDEVRAYNFFQQKDMPVYADELTQRQLKKEFHYAFAERKYPGVPNIQLHTIETNKTITVGDITLLPIEVWHCQLPIKAFRIGNFAYVTDANHIDETQLQLLKGVDVLVLNALRHEKHISHFTLQEAISVALHLQPKKTYFTHISHQLGLHQEVEKKLPPNMFLSYDGLIIHV